MSGVGVVSAESRKVRPPPQKKKSIKSPGALAPPAPAPHTKKCKTLSQKGDLRGALSLGSRGPWPSPALPRTPRPARSGPEPRGPHGWPEAGPGLGGAMSCRYPMGTTPLHTHPRLRASTVRCLRLLEPLSHDTEPGAGWRCWAAGKDWNEVGGVHPPCSQPGPVLPLPHPALHCPPSA